MIKTLLWGKKLDFFPFYSRCFCYRVQAEFERIEAVLRHISKSQLRASACLDVPPILVKPDEQNYFMTIFRTGFFLATKEVALVTIL